ncbi:MAG: hypothetical protein H7A32_01350 [Deltaproteobacteria bacterium]|nr:hypothetical protein [Deltaproteobacteria bacterium]
MKNKLVKIISGLGLFAFLAVAGNAFSMQIFVKTLTGKTVTFDQNANIETVVLDSDAGEVTCDAAADPTGGTNGYTCRDAAGSAYTLQLISEGTGR